MEERNGQGVRMSDVAGAAGVSRQAVYDHFGSRSDLMVSTVRYGDTVLGLDGRLSRYRAASSGTERLGAFVEFWGNYVPEIHGIARALLSARENDEAVAAAWDDRMGVVYEACRETPAAPATSLIRTPCPLRSSINRHVASRIRVRVPDLLDSALDTM